MLTSFIERAYALTSSQIGDVQTPLLDLKTNGNTDLPTVVSTIINIVLFVAGALAIIYMIYSGILYITAAGNPDNAKKGSQGVMNGAIGIAICVLAYYLVSSVAVYVRTGIK